MNEPRLLKGHTNYVNDVVFTPNEEMLVSAGMDNIIIIWDVKNWEKIGELTGHTKSVNSVILTRDSQKIISASTDATLKIWEIKSGKEMQTLHGHKKTVSGIDLSPDNQYLASGSYDATVRLWSPLTGEEVNILKGERARTRFSPQGSLVVGGAGGNIKFYHVPDLDEEFTIAAHKTYVMDFVFTQDGQHLISSGYDKKIRKWIVKTGEEVFSIDIDAKGGVYPLALAPDDKEFAVACDHKLMRYLVESGKLISEENLNPKGNYSVKYSPDGTLIALGSADKLIRIWEL